MPIAEITHDIQLIVSIRPVRSMTYGTAREHIERYITEHWPEGGWKFIDADLSEDGPDHDKRWWFLYSQTQPLDAAGHLFTQAQNADDNAATTALQERPGWMAAKEDY